MHDVQFYDNSILSGTKIGWYAVDENGKFYDNSILSGTKIITLPPTYQSSFTITQFFQVLKLIQNH